MQWQMYSLKLTEAQILKDSFFSARSFCWICKNIKIYLIIKAFQFLLILYNNFIGIVANQCAEYA